MVKKCEFCGKYFKADKRVKDRQKACQRIECKKKRKKCSQKNWCKNNPEYFKGRYWYVKEWRAKRGFKTVRQVIQDKIQLPNPLIKLILLIPASKSNMIQDKIVLRKIAKKTFLADMG